MTKRKELEATVARAEASLGKAITHGAKADSDQIHSVAEIEKARAFCRQSRAALNHFIRSDR